MSRFSHFWFDAEKGLWLTDDFPHRSRTGRDVKPDRREFTGETTPRPVPLIRLPGAGELERHVQGRADAAAELIIGLAFLRAEGLASDSDTVTCTGAVYQDTTGETTYPRAHRFPCNPWLGIFTIPELARHRHPALSGVLKEPLAVTDPVPLVVNYADGLFEEHGPYQVVADAVREVIQEQRIGKPVNVNLVRHVVTFSFLPGFQRAYDVARQELQKDIDKEAAGFWGRGNLPFGGKSLEQLNRLSLSLKIDPNKPTHNRETAQDLLFLSANIARSYQPPLVLPDRAREQAGRLRSLTKKS